MTPDLMPFLALPNCPLDEADAVVAPLPFERTTSYGKGTAGGPEAMLTATSQIECFDEQTGVDFEAFPRVHTRAPVPDTGHVESYLERVAAELQNLRDRFVVSLGGEHTVTYGAVLGLAERPEDVTIVHLDAHADLIDELDGRRWSHGTVMRRLLEQGCRLVQIGVRSLSREEYELIGGHERVATFFAHELPARWPEVLALVGSLAGDVYLSLDVDALDPSVIPSTGTPQPDGLSWRDVMAVLQAATAAAHARLVGADLVEFVPSPTPPGCDLTAAKLLVKLLAFWAVSQGRSA